MVDSSKTSDIERQTVGGKSSRDPVLEFTRQDRTTRSSSGPAILPIQQLGRALKARRDRDGFFASNLFSDPAWDMLLHAYVTHLQENGTSVSDLSCAAGVPLSTGLRWLSQLESDGLMHRQIDPANPSQSLVRLTPKGIIAMRRYLESLQGPVLPL